MRHTFQLCITTTILLCAQSALAQTTTSGDIRGSVTDSTGAVIPGVTVTVENLDTSVVLRTVTDGSGVYDTGSIVPDHYKLIFKKMALAPWSAARLRSTSALRASTRC